MSTWLVMLLAGAGTYLLRVSMVLAHERTGTPRWLERRLPLVGPSVLAAIIVSSMLSAHGGQALPDPVAVAAVVGAFLAVKRTGNVASALFVGFPIFWVGVALGWT